MSRVIYLVKGGRKNQDEKQDWQNTGYYLGMTFCQFVSTRGFTQKEVPLSIFILKSHFCRYVLNQAILSLPWLPGQFPPPTMLENSSGEEGK